jgi:hypothetical protein
MMKIWNKNTEIFIFLFKLSKHNIYLTGKFTNKIHPFFPFFLFKSMINNIPESNKWINISDFFYMHLFTMQSQCVLNRSSNQDYNIDKCNKILCLSSRNMIDKTMCEVLWRNISDFYVNLRVEVGKFYVCLNQWSTIFQNQTNE